MCPNRPCSGRNGQRHRRWRCGPRLKPRSGTSQGWCWTADRQAHRRPRKHPSQDRRFERQKRRCLLRPNPSPIRCRTTPGRRGRRKGRCWPWTMCCSPGQGSGDQRLDLHRFHHPLGRSQRARLGCQWPASWLACLRASHGPRSRSGYRCWPRRQPRARCRRWSSRILRSGRRWPHRGWCPNRPRPKRSLS